MTHVPTPPGRDPAAPGEPTPIGDPIFGSDASSSYSSGDGGDFEPAADVPEESAGDEATPRRRARRRGRRGGARAVAAAGEVDAGFEDAAADDTVAENGALTDGSLAVDSAQEAPSTEPAKRAPARSRSRATGSASRRAPRAIPLPEAEFEAPSASRFDARGLEHDGEVATVAPLDEDETVEGNAPVDGFDGDGSDERAAAAEGEDAPRRKKRRRRGRRSKRGGTTTGTAGDGSIGEGAVGLHVDDHEEGAGWTEESDANEGDEPADGEGDPARERDGDDSAGGGVSAPRKKRSRRSRRSRKGATVGSDRQDGDAAGSSDDADADAEPSVRAGASGLVSKGPRRKSARRGKGRRDDAPPREEPGAVGIESIPGEEDDLAELDPVPRPARSRRVAIDPDEAPHQIEVPRDQRILVNAADPEETRVVVVEGSKIVDLQMTVRDHESYVNDIYRGRVVNLETAIGAAFVDFGQGRNGFLHVSDVMEVYGDEKWSLDKLLTARTDPEDWGNGGKADEIEGDEKRAESKGKRSKGKPRPRQRKRHAISDLLQKGQTVAVQITKDAIGDKGPTLTTFISIPGRYLVLMPSLQRTGVSRKIEDDKERRRLKRILQSLEIPEGMGVIVRTAGVGRTKADIKRDLDYLIAVWQDFSKKLVLGRNPAPLYQESDVAIRTMRDLFSARTEAVLVDSAKVYEHMREFTQKLMPEHLDRIVLHEAPKPLFHQHAVEPDFERIFARRVELPSGGSIVIDQTEALVAIDVNSGRTRDEGADFEDIALKTNLEAAPEIARQIRLRDLGGILVLDFIDMLRQSSRKLVERTLRDALATDRARSKVGRISQFGLLELTRQRLGPGLSRLVYDTCPTCKGSGRRRTAQSRAQAVLRRLASALSQKGFTKIEVLCHHDTVAWLQKRNRAELAELEERGKREIILRGVDEQAEESIFHYLRADGREVRPGGRRKR